ncbi:MAG: class I SAM-dependent methyltransferase [Desulfobulbaceae bacterium]|nr:class I SAM-dependent methyltransferase [Desulfobulbaceae bacterium]
MTTTLFELNKLAADSLSRIDLWEKIVLAIEAEAVAEIGVWKGDFAKDILHRCPGITKYYMVDPWANLPDWNKPFNVKAEMFDEVYAEAMGKTEFASHKRVVLRGRTKEIIDKIPDESLDFAYIDGDHTLRGITIDLIRLLPKIKEGGIIGGDDFAHNPWQHSVDFEPTLVCPFSIYFCEAMNLPISALPHDQYIIKKSNQQNFEFVDLTGNYKDISLNKLPSLPTAQRENGMMAKVCSLLGRIGCRKK